MRKLYDCKVARSCLLFDKVMVSMYFKTPKCAYPVIDVEDFLEGKKDVRQVGSSEVGFGWEGLPPTREVVLKLAL